MKIAVLTSGGDAPGMNAAIRGVVRNGICEGMEVYGIYRGYEGILDGDIRQMDAASVSDILHRGGTILRTARCKRFFEAKWQQKAAENLKNNGIRNLIVIGGDGSFRGGKELSGYGINVFGIPGTIDNDLAYTDMTIGFDTAVNTAVSVIGNIRDTSSSHERSTIIEVMGRSCGDIAIWAGIASGAENILVPEVSFDIDSLCEKLTQGRRRGKLHNLVVKAEGVDYDLQKLANKISRKTGMETRVVVLGHIQRGGSPTVIDRIIATKMGSEAVRLIKEGKKRNQAIGIREGKIFSEPLDTALTREKRANTADLQLADNLSI